MVALRQIVRCERAATAIEYALVAGLIAIAAIAGFQNLAGKMGTMYNNVSNHL